MSDAHTRKSRLTVPSGGGGGSASFDTTTTPLSSSFRGTTTRSIGASSSTIPYDWHRLTDFRQMDVQAALDQMKTLLSTRPQAVYKTAYYRKQTKNHWARDDPAFCVLQAALLILAGIAYAIAFRAAWMTSLSFLLQSLVWNWWGCGIVIAATGRALAHQHLLTAASSTSTTHVRQHVEFWYAFDIHCNAFFPVFVLLYGLQFFTMPVVLGNGWFPLLLANTLYCAAGLWYWYVTHLGYRALPFVQHTEVFLAPCVAIAILYIGSLILAATIGWNTNAARIMAKFYFV